MNLFPWVGYYKIWDEFFRDENVSDPHAMLDVFYNLDNGGTLSSSYGFASEKPLKCGKYHDYFTSCLPAPQKGDAVLLPIGVSAPIEGDISSSGPFAFSGPSGLVAGGTAVTNFVSATGNGPLHVYGGAGGDNTLTYSGGLDVAGLSADLSSATGAPINSIRFAFQLQKFLERDARHGTRYSGCLRRTSAWCLLMLASSARSASGAFISAWVCPKSSKPPQLLAPISARSEPIPSPAFRRRDSSISPLRSTGISICSGWCA